MSTWFPKVQQVQKELYPHEEDWSFSAIMGRRILICKHCREPKGSKAWDYPCPKAPIKPPPPKEEVTALPPFDPNKCTCSCPPHRPPCGYCESGEYDPDTV